MEAAGEAIKHTEILMEYREIFPDGTVEEIDYKIRKWDQDPENSENPYVEVKRGDLASFGDVL